ncbi:hypothetical protein [Kordiimonas sp. SCSIO 12610]|uniref:hypothetical protein n=1 Tax=Kordiimonas sp. SCSIO 12610 TaxID=2829597 RepID=UPI002109E636|nr:hypothetical protein [Kordiimonas sp. SCSIO 12610]UTW56725.1 hypothetical protein KFF44_07510 [Kordiimonas sp. SCSIO 12610]
MFEQYLTRISEFMIRVSNLIKNCIAITSALIISATVTAQGSRPVNPANFQADPGIYDPVTFGDDITFNGCGSSFENFSLCELNDLSDFALAWRVSPQGQDPLAEGTTVALFGLGVDVSSVNGFTENTTFGTNVADGLNFTINSGAASAFFPTPGSYTLQLSLLVRGRQFVQLPNGNLVNTFFSGTLVRRAETVIEFARNAPVTVPEPIGFLVIIPAMYYIVRRQRKLAYIKA